MKATFSRPTPNCQHVDAEIISFDGKGNGEIKCPDCGGVSIGRGYDWRCSSCGSNLIGPLLTI